MVDFNQILKNLVYFYLLCMMLPAGHARELGSDGSTQQVESLVGPQRDCTPIGTAQELQNLQHNLSGTYCQTADIDLANIDFEPLGSEANPFSGRYNGNGYKIHNFARAQAPFGLFFAITGRISNTHLVNASIDCVIEDENTKTRCERAGLLSTFLLGEAEGDNTIRPVVENSSVQGAIRVQSLHEFQGQSAWIDLAGSFAAVSRNALMSNLSSDVEIHYALLDDGSVAHWIGGLVGLADELTDMIDITSSGSITIDGKANSVGAIAGYYRGLFSPQANSSLTRAVANANITISGSVAQNIGGVGGLVGRAYYLDIVDSHFVGQVTAQNLVGGLVGRIDESSVSSSTSSGSVQGNMQVGGLAGLIFKTTITESQSDSVILGASELGGAIGVLQQSYLADLSSFGEVQAIGEAVGDPSIENCGGFSACAGGLVGILNGGEIHRSFAHGNTSAAGHDRVGGFVGVFDFRYLPYHASYIFDSKAFGHVEGRQFVGGFVGHMPGSRYAENPGEIVSHIHRSGAYGNVSSFSDSTGECNIFSDQYEDCRWIGGFAGAIGPYTRIARVASYGQVSTDGNIAGGLAGFVGDWGGKGDDYHAFPLVWDSVTESNVSGRSTGIGGLIGAVACGGDVAECQLKQSLSTGRVEAHEEGGVLGGLVAIASERNAAQIQSIHCFWDSENSQQSDSAIGTPKNTQELKTRSTYDSWGYFDSKFDLIEGETYPWLIELE